RGWNRRCWSPSRGPEGGGAQYSVDDTAYTLSTMRATRARRPHRLRLMSTVLVIGNKNYSSWSLRPWLFLKVHGIPFEERRIPLYRDESRERLLAVSGSGRVPVLLHDGLKVWDSLAILETLAELHPRLDGWPTNLSDRTWARAISAEMHGGFG